jgi:hypothetical protein
MVQNQKNAFDYIMLIAFELGRKSGYEEGCSKEIIKRS